MDRWAEILIRSGAGYHLPRKALISQGCGITFLVGTVKSLPDNIDRSKGRLREEDG